jgi:small-conductance mechanosensitive channel
LETCPRIGQNPVVRDIEENQSTLLSILADNSGDLQSKLSQWIPTAKEIVRGLVIAGTILVGGTILFALLRKYILRAKLAAAYWVAIFAAAIFFGVAGLKPERFLQSDPGAIWLARFFVAALLFSAVRAFDRLLIIPVLTRGGRVPAHRFLHQIVIIVISCFVILGFASYAFGLEIKTFLAGSAVVSIVLGLALQETLGNFFSGLVMQASSPFAIGDWIVCAGVEGRVVDMTWRAVTIHTLEDNYVIMPNGTIASEQIVNYYTPTRATARIVSVGLEYDLPPGEGIAVLKAAALETPGVAATPEPFVYLDEFADSSINYLVKFWVSEPALHKKIEHHVRVNIWYRLKEKGYGIPYPVRTVEHVPLKKKLQQQEEAAAEHRYQAIKDLWLFAPMTEEQKRELARGASDAFLAEGQVLFSQGHMGDSLYVIRTGQVDVMVRHGNGNESKVATLKAGDFFGEMSALTGQPRTATIRASGELACLRIGKNELAAVFSSDPSIMEKISEIIAHRNAHRESVVQQAVSAAEQAQQVKTEQKSLLGKMLSFFGKGAK